MMLYGGAESLPVGVVWLACVVENKSVPFLHK